VSFVTQSELARLANVTRQIVNRKVQKGEIKLSGDRLVDVEKGLAVLGKNKQKENGNGTKPSYWDEQTRLAGHKADLAAMESKRRAHELVEADLAAKEFGKFVFAVRQRFLGMGSRLAPQLAKKTAAFIKRGIDEAVDEALDEFGKYNPETGDCGPVKPARKARKGGPKAKTVTKKRKN